MEDTIGAAWPLEKCTDDNTALPPPWDGVADFENRTTEAALVELQYRDPLLALRVCRSVFCRAEERGDKQAALHALFLACINLYNSSQRASADGVFAIVRERARGMNASHLSARIALADAKQLSEQGEHAQAMIVRQHALDLAMALGDNRVIFFALGGLAVSAAEAGESGLTLSLCAQQKPLLTEEDPVIAGAYFHHTVLMACAWIQIAHGHEIADERAAARSALEQARTLALSACDRTNNDREALHCLETLVQILLLLDEAAEARAQVEHCVASLAAVPTVGSELWCVLELARARISVHDGDVGAQTLKTLQAIEESVRQTASDVQLLIGEVRQVLLRAQEQLGHHEQALSSHKRATQWQADRRSAQSRQRMKMLRHAVLAMRAEAVEFIAHDLLTPLAAARTWMQALLREPMQSARTSPLRDARELLNHATTLSEQYLGLLRCELMPSAQMQVLDFGALVDDVCENVLPSMSSGLRFTRTIDIDTPVRGDAALLMKAMAALLVDALDRAPAGSRLALLLKRDVAAGEAVLSIAHEGACPPPAARMWLYQQSFDGDLLGNGNLGLALAAKVCHACAVVRERARGLGLCRLSARIELNYAGRLEAQGEYAQAMVLRQKVLEAAMALGDARLLCFALNSLAIAAEMAGQDDLALSLCEQLEPLLTGDDVVVLGLGSAHANTMALIWKRIAQAREASGDHTAATAALLHARDLALRACAGGRCDGDVLRPLETLVRILLRLDEVAEARAQLEHYIAILVAAPSVGSELWCLLELTRLRIDMREGRISAPVVEMLEAIYESTGPKAPTADEELGDVQHVLLQAQEQLGRFEQALSSHKRVTGWRFRQRSAAVRQRLKMLRHTVLAMRAEAVEFITHDLLTPLAAARTSLQALRHERSGPALAPPLHHAHGLLARATMLSEQYLALWRAELTPLAQLQPLDLGALADDICENFKPLEVAKPTHLERDLRIGACILGDRILLTRALMVLLLHAAQQAREGTPVRLHLRVAAGREGGAAVLSVGFRGSCPEPALRMRVYQRFADSAVVSTADIGWLLVARVAQLHRARLRFKTTAADDSSMQLTFALRTLHHDRADL